MDGSYPTACAPSAAFSFVSLSGRTSAAPLRLPLTGRAVALTDWLDTQSSALQVHQYEGLRDDPTRDPPAPLLFGKRRRWGDTGIWRVSFVPTCPTCPL